MEAAPKIWSEENIILFILTYLYVSWWKESRICGWIPMDLNIPNSLLSICSNKIFYYIVCRVWYLSFDYIRCRLTQCFMSSSVWLKTGSRTLACLIILIYVLCCTNRYVSYNFMLNYVQDWWTKLLLEVDDVFFLSVYQT